MAQSYQELITEGIKGLPEAALAQIVEYVNFIKKKAQNPEFEDQLNDYLLHFELKKLSRNEQAHLEDEAVGYEQP